MYDLNTIISMNREAGNVARSNNKKPYKAICNNDKGVRTCPDLGDYTPEGFKLVNKYFVDNSGFGSDTEPALTFNGFLNNVKEGFYYGIIEAGQFQVYIGEFIKDSTYKKLKDPNILHTKKLSKSLRVTEYKTGEKIWRLYDTDIIILKDNKATLNSGGYLTNTTKTRINEVLNLKNINIYQKSYKWYVKLSDNKIIPFKDSMIIDF